MQIKFDFASEDWSGHCGSHRGEVKAEMNS